MTIMATFSTSVAASSDDAIENVSTGNVNRTANIEASAIYLAGLRFTNVTIPQGATITSATLDVVVNNSTSDIPDIDTYCQAADNAAAFSTTPYDISSRALTTAKGQWIVASPGTGSGAKTSPDFSAPLQELVNRPGWASGNAAVFLMYNRGSSDFRFQSYDTGTAATLNVTYVPAAIKVDLDTLSMTGAAVSLTVVPGAFQVILKTLQALASVENLTVVPGTATVILRALYATITAESLTVIPGGVTAQLDTLAAFLSAISLTVSVDNVDQTINLAEIIAQLQAESVTPVPGPVALLLDVLTAALATQPLDVTLGAFDVFLQMQRAQLSAALPSLAVVPGTAVVRLDTIGMTATLDDLLLFLMLACVNVRDRARFEATVDNVLRYHVTVSDRTGCE